MAASGYGLVLIHSATASYATGRFVKVQAACLVIGLVGFVIASLIDLEKFRRFWKWIFLLNLLLQLSLFVFGVEDGGNRSWIRFDSIGIPIGIQPAEIGKLLFIFTFARHLTRVRGHINEVKTLLGLGLHLGVMVGVILASSSDMGMALAYVFICVFMVFAAGVSIKWVFGALGAVVLAVPLLWNFVLEKFQKNRILVLFDPEIDPDTAYQTIQSKIAIGAGGLTGEGYMNGRQVQYGSLPAKHTDFIFSVGAEEFGMVGAAAILLVLSLIILRLLYISYKADTPFSSLLCVGICGMFLYQTFENILMCVGLCPVMGLTLPFFSYGGTSLVTMFLAVGIAAGVRMREKPSWLK